MNNNVNGIIVTSDLLSSINFVTFALSIYRLNWY